MNEECLQVFANVAHVGFIERLQRYLQDIHKKLSLSHTGFFSMPRNSEHVKNPRARTFSNFLAKRKTVCKPLANPDEKPAFAPFNKLTLMCHLTNLLQMAFELFFFFINLPLLV